MIQLLLSLAQLAVALILSAIVAFLAVYLFQWFTRGLDEWDALRQGNLAVGIVLGAMLVGVALVLRPAVAVDASSWDVGTRLFLPVLVTEALQVGLGLIFALVTLALALTLFAALTRGLDEVAEIKNGNLAVATLLAGVILAVALLVSHAIAQVLSQVPPLLL